MDGKNNMAVAAIILQQLGDKKFKAMTGAKNFIAGQNSLTFSIPGSLAKNRINKVTVTYDESTDTYTLEFFRIRMSKKNLILKNNGMIEKLIEKRDLICSDILQESFTSITGLDTHL